jgi:hypothetical protein
MAVEQFAFERGEEALAHRVVVAVADEGGAAVAFASGMAGIAAVFDQLPSGSVVLRAKPNQVHSASGCG